ncbi:VOC family protein [Aggregatimonas sangjinii]|uniref:VOC family protein n=1 Tax=Aggregatimonas sangjinii TaxID=2583587 RepID=A0A5B7SSX7_9FLAO|nr:VOC family protein [Aggregatimonas sangjinii]QCX00429.1 VOC family protein [Aggregatimonas sangjinii]
MRKTFNGIQQIGIGVADAKAVFNWYRKHLGFDILVFEDESKANLMTQYTDNTVHNRYAMLAMNMIGGGGLEIWQFKSREPKPPVTPILLGDLGIHTMKLRCHDVSKAFQVLTYLPNIEIGEISVTMGESPTLLFIDPWGNSVQLVQDSYCFDASKAICGGVLGAIIGVSDMEMSICFYTKILGYDIIAEDRSGFFEDFSSVEGGGNIFRRVLLKHTDRSVGGFGELLGPTEIELVQALDRVPSNIYKNRLWGDLGYIHLCFDVQGMKLLRDEAKALNYPFTVDSASSFDMGDAAGHFSYIEDPDGTLIEFVETHKVPILKKLGWFINLKKRNPVSPLPKWLVKAMRIHRVKKDL